MNRSRNTSRWLLVLVLRLLMGAAWADDSQVIAYVGNTEVRIGDLKPLVGDLTATQKEQMAQDPSKLEQAVRTWLVQRLFLQEATAKRFDSDPQVSGQLKRSRDTALVQLYVQSVSKPPASYPSEAEIRAAYEQAKPGLMTPRQYRLAQIYIAAPETKNPLLLAAAESRMEDVQNALEKPKADFAAVAKAQSDDKSSAGQGGEIGWLLESQIQPELRPQVTTLIAGSVGAPIRLADGWHILKCLEIKESTQMPLAMVRTQLIEEMRTAKTQENAQAYIDKMLQVTPLRLQESNLGKLLR